MLSGNPTAGVKQRWSEFSERASSVGKADKRQFSFERISRVRTQLDNLRQPLPIHRVAASSENEGMVERKVSETLGVPGDRCETGFAGGSLGELAPPMRFRDFAGKNSWCLVERRSLNVPARCRNHSTRCYRQIDVRCWPRMPREAQGSHGKRSASCTRNRWLVSPRSSGKK